jgi:hypothetical protein
VHDEGQALEDDDRGSGARGAVRDHGGRGGSCADAVIGTGGGGGAWWRPVSGATITVQDAVQTATTAADGTYSLTAIGGPLYYSGKAITATHRWYRTGQKLLGGDAFQVQTFRLTVKSTTFNVTVKSGSRKIKGAKVSCFGKRATTKGTGRATLSGLQLKPLTRYTVRITKPGYRTVSFKASSKPGGTVKFTKSIKRK